MYALDFQAEQGERHCRERPHMDVRAGLVVEARIAQTASAAWKAEVQILQEQKSGQRPRREVEGRIHI